jgi:hypothetical protein
MVAVLISARIPSPHTLVVVMRDSLFLKINTTAVILMNAQLMDMDVKMSVLIVRDRTHAAAATAML